MKKLQVVFLFVFLVGCSPSQTIILTGTPDIAQTPSPPPTETSLPPTQTLTPPPTMTPMPAATAIGGGAGKIAFTSERDGVTEIYVINLDDGALMKVSNNITPAFNPSWSPDGKKIAFGSSNDDSASLYLMDADGSNPTQIFDTREIGVYDPANHDLRFVSGCCSAVWSPDGNKIAFKVAHYFGCCLTYGYIHVLNADGSYLTSIALPVWEDPVWSPDSQKIAFGADCGGLGGVCVTNADGTNPINIAPGGNPIWSPDGNKIAFHSGPYNNVEVYVMNADGSNQINLTNYGGGWDGNPIWSPDGKKIAFSSYRDGNWEIYVMNIDGTDILNLTNNPASDHSAAWSPDSTKLLFLSDRDGNSEIYIINTDGSNPVRLTENDANDYSPVWSP